MTEIAHLFTDFFRDLDVVPSDVIAGLVLLRRYQKLRMQGTVQQVNSICTNNDLVHVLKMHFHSLTFLLVSKSGKLFALVLPWFLLATN